MKPYVSLFLSMAVVFAILVFVWNMGTFSYPQPVTTYTGFKSLIPSNGAQTSFKTSGSGAILFINTIKSEITLISISINDIYDKGFSCEVGPEGISPNNKIEYGGNFVVTFPVGCLHAGSIGDVYNTDISIKYSELVNGSEEARTEGGTIRGLYA